MAHSSTIQILKVEVREGVSKRTQLPYVLHSAEVLLLTDDGEVELAGSLPLPRSLVDVAKVGTFRAGFSMIRQSTGDRRGDIVSQLVSLTPVPVRGSLAGGSVAAPAPAAAPSAPAAKP